MNAIWIPVDAYNDLLEEARNAYPLETGGVLAGYVAENGEFVIQYVVGPGPSAVHKRERFEPDHDWHCSKLDEIFEKSSKRSAYLGDWHTHPDGAPSMSGLDRRTLRSIARHPETALARPVMMIGAGKENAWTWKAHQYIGYRLRCLLSNYAALNVRVF